MLSVTITLTAICYRWTATFIRAINAVPVSIAQERPGYARAIASTSSSAVEIISSACRALY